MDESGPVGFLRAARVPEGLSTDVPSRWDIVTLQGMRKAIVASAFVSSTVLAALVPSAVSAATSEEIAGNLLEQASAALGIDITDQELIEELTDGLEFAIEDGSIPDDEPTSSVSDSTAPESIGLPEDVTAAGVILAATLIASGNIDDAVASGLVTPAEVDEARAAIENGTLDRWVDLAESD